MKLTMEHKPVLQALGNLQGVVERRTSIPILSHVLLEADNNLCRLTATNLDIQSVYALPAIVTEPGKAVLPAQILHDIVRNLHAGAQINMETKEEGLVLLSAGRGSFKLNSLSADEFPDLESGSFPHSFSMPTADLQRLVEKTIFAASSDEGRYYLNGIYFHVPKEESKLRGVATDGYRLACADCPLPEKAKTIPGIIVPRKTLAEIRRLLESDEKSIEIGLSKNMIRFQCGPATITSKLVDGVFPDYSRVIPEKNSKSLTVGRDAFTQSVQRVAAVHSDGMAAVKMDFSKNILSLAASNHDVASSLEEMEIDYKDEDIQIGFQARYLLDITQHMGEKIRIEMDTPGAPTILRDCGDEHLIYVLMPMRV